MNRAAPARTRLPETKTGSGRLGLAAATALYIAGVLGSGVLVLPGLTAGVAGPASVVAVVVSFALSIPMAMTFAVLAARYPDPGGVASYVRRSLGNTAARAAGYWFFFGIPWGIPILMLLGSEYLTAVLGLSPALIPVLGLGFFAVPFTVNWFGLRVASWAQFLLTGLLLVVVVWIGAIALPAISQSRFEPFLPHGWDGVGTAISMFVWAFAGWEVGTHIAGEFRNPSRVIPLATTLALLVVGASYIVLQFVTIGVLPDRDHPSVVPLFDLVTVLAPGWGPWLTASVAVIVTVGVLNVYLPAFGNLGAALAERGDLPRALARGVEAGVTPRPAVAVVGVMALGYYSIVVATGMNLAPFLLFHSATMVAIYAAGMLAAVRLLRRGSFGWGVAVLALGLCIGLLGLAGVNLVAPLALAGIAVIVGAVQRRRQTPTIGEG